MLIILWCFFCSFFVGNKQLFKISYNFPRPDLWSCTQKQLQSETSLFLFPPHAWTERAGCPANITTESWACPTAHSLKLRRTLECDNTDWLELCDAGKHRYADWLERPSCLRAPENKLERVMYECPWDSTDSPLIGQESRGTSVTDWGELSAYLKREKSAMLGWGDCTRRQIWTGYKGPRWNISFIH